MVTGDKQATIDDSKMRKEQKTVKCGAMKMTKDPIHPVPLLELGAVVFSKTVSSGEIFLDGASGAAQGRPCRCPRRLGPSLRHPFRTYKAVGETGILTRLENYMRKVSRTLVCISQGLGKLTRTCDLKGWTDKVRAASRKQTVPTSYS